MQILVQDLRYALRLTLQRPADTFRRGASAGSIRRQR
jgi:hypothetical protein